MAAIISSSSPREMIQPSRGISSTPFSGAAPTPMYQREGSSGSSKASKRGAAARIRSAAACTA
jgi:hypothetical protein